MIRGAWSFSASIHLVEAHAEWLGLRRAARDASLHGHRVGSLGDNLPCVLSFSKGRGHDPALRVYCRRAAALEFACEIQWRQRHLSSEDNPTDRDSRAADRGELEPGVVEEPFPRPSWARDSLGLRAGVAPAWHRDQRLVLVRPRLGPIPASPAACAQRRELAGRLARARPPRPLLASGAHRSAAAQRPMPHQFSGSDRRPPVARYAASIGSDSSFRVALKSHYFNVIHHLVFEPQQHYSIFSHRIARELEISIKRNKLWHVSLSPPTIGPHRYILQCLRQCRRIIRLCDMAGVL